MKNIMKNLPILGNSFRAEYAYVPGQLTLISERCVGPYGRGRTRSVGLSWSAALSLAIAAAGPRKLCHSGPPGPPRKCRSPGAIWAVTQNAHKVLTCCMHTLSFANNNT